MAQYELSDEEIGYLGAGLLELANVCATQMIRHSDQAAHISEFMNEISKINALKIRLAAECDDQKERV